MYTDLGLSIHAKKIPEKSRDTLPLRVCYIRHLNFEFSPAHPHLPPVFYPLSHHFLLPSLLCSCYSLLFFCLLSPRCLCIL
jgi:hypothetical protein